MKANWRRHSADVQFQSDSDDSVLTQNAHDKASYQRWRRLSEHLIWRACLNTGSRRVSLQPCAAG